MSLETRELGSVYLPLSKTELLALQDALENSSYSKWTELIALSGIGGIGFYTPLIGFAFSAMVMAGILLVTDTAEENIAEDLQAVANTMNNNEYVVVELKEELVAPTIGDFLNYGFTERNLLYFVTSKNSGTSRIPLADARDFIEN
jgi:hypothetical protein